MQLWTILLLGLALTTHSRPLHPRKSGIVTLPLRRVESKTDTHLELRHQQHINRAQRLVARASGVSGPSDAELRANLERRASFLPAHEKRFNVPLASLTPSGSNTGASQVASFAVDGGQNSSAAVSAPALVQHSSAIAIDGADISYVFPVKIGTPGREFNIILDSGSGDFWVSSTRCSSENNDGCGNHNFLGQDTSSSFVNTGRPWEVTYGSGFAKEGEIVTDRIVVGGMVIENHTFGVSHFISSSFSGPTIADGLMGLGKRGLSSQGVPTPVEALRTIGFFDNAITSYRLPRLLDNNVGVGEISFGGLDESRFDPSTKVTVKADDSDFWIIPVDGVSVNGGSVSISAKSALMDTGTTLLVVPTKDAEAIHAQIPGAKPTESGQFSIPCDTTVEVALRFGGRDFVINPKDLLFASGGRTTGDCTSGIAAFNDNKFLVGDTFLKSVYFSHNVDDNSVTLANPL